MTTPLRPRQLAVQPRNRAAGRVGRASRSLALGEKDPRKYRDANDELSPDTYRFPLDIEEKRAGVVDNQRLHIVPMPGVTSSSIPAATASIGCSTHPSCETPFARMWERSKPRNGTESFPTSGPTCSRVAARPATS